MDTRGSVVIVGLNYAPETTGIAPYTSALARGLAARGWRVRVITTHPHYPSWTLPAAAPWSEDATVDGVRVSRRRHFVPRRPRGVLRLLSEVSFGLRAVTARWGRADVVVLVSPSLFASAMAILRLRLTGQRTPVLTWIQDLYSLGITETGQGSSRVAAAMARVESWTVRQSDVVAVIHDRFRDHVLSELGGFEDSTAVVRNWTHLADRPPVDRRAVRHRLGWSDSDVVVVHAGAMGVKQGLSNVIDAAELAASRSSAVRFVMIGGGSQRAALVASAHGVPTIEILDSLPDEEFQAALQAADVLLVNEKPGVAGMAVPSKLTSYFNAARPVVAATDPGSVTESEVRRAGAGVVVPAGDPVALVVALEALGSDPAHADELGRSGLAFRREFLAEERAIDGYARILADLRRGASAHARRANDSSTQGTH
ncbi:glycosyltransferase family 4 protein [Curtobacterium sp. RRHDQ10]|uniref:glycosyltransferase family 4 protein n=1 Tax=Curtobacterium phyllosphaerae TaxID=3413379 RepID=UPI003BF444FD